VPVGQTLPQAPQFCESELRVAQVVPHSAWSAAHTLGPPVVLVAPTVVAPLVTGVPALGPPLTVEVPPPVVAVADVDAAVDVESAVRPLHPQPTPRLKTPDTNSRKKAEARSRMQFH